MMYVPGRVMSSTTTVLSVFIQRLSTELRLKYVKHSRNQ